MPSLGRCHMITILVLIFLAVAIPCACIPYWIRRGRLRAAVTRKQEYLAIELSPVYQQKLERERAYHLALTKMDLERERFNHQVHTDLAKLWMETHYLPAERYIVNAEVNSIMALPSLKREQIKVADEAIAVPSSLPTYVRYEDVRSQVPAGHVLVGVGQSGVDTREEKVGACVWIVGLSGTGKTSTTVIRVEERHERGHKFLGADPHWFKPDSLTNALVPYASSFLMPIAQTSGETLGVFKFFLDEFKGRKEGRIPRPWQKITLLVDEVNALMDATTEEEKELGDMLKTIARICGQEARNFEMGGILISQQATNLAWLRKVALMIIVHQLLMKSEKDLACNGDSAVIDEMKTWPIGRTYVYGVGFQDGPRTVQQPYFKPKVVNQESIPEQTGSPFRFEMPERNAETLSVSDDETAPEAMRDNVTPWPFRVSVEASPASIKKSDSGVSEETKKTIMRMKRANVPLRDIAKFVGLSGEKYDVFKQVCIELGISDKKVEA